MDDFYFIPQQTGNARKLPLKIVTFCYHPNIMTEQSFLHLEAFLKKNYDKFGDFKKIVLKNRRLNFFDKLLKTLYFSMRHIKQKVSSSNTVAKTCTAF
jgi:hypothetical protein